MTLTRCGLNTTTRCHSVRSWRSPERLSVQDSDVAMLRLAMPSPFFMVRISGSRPTFPSKMTLLTDDIDVLLSDCPEFRVCLFQLFPFLGCPVLHEPNRFDVSILADDIAPELDLFFENGQCVIELFHFPLVVSRLIADDDFFHLRVIRNEIPPFKLGYQHRPHDLPLVFFDRVAVGLPCLQVIQVLRTTRTLDFHAPELVGRNPVRRTRPCAV